VNSQHLATGPVTYGQLSLLRSVEGIPEADAHVANLPDSWRLPDALAVSAVEQAWNRLVAVHDSLRTTFAQRDGVWSQRIGAHVPATLPITVVPAADAATADEIAHGLADEALDLDVGPLWRASIVSDERGPRFLALAIHHVAADASGMKVLAEDFAALLAGTDVRPTSQPLDLALREREEAPAKENAYWLGRWTDLVEADRTGNDDTKRERVELFSEAAGAAVGELARRSKVSPQAVILGCLGLALSRLAGRDRLTIGLMSANRWLPETVRLVSSLNQLVPQTLVMDPDHAVAALFRATYANGLQALAHGKFDVDLLRDQASAQGHPNPDPMAFDCHFNFVEGAPRPQAGDPVRTRVLSRDRDLLVLPRLNLTAAADDHGVMLRMMASRHYLDGTPAAAVLGGVEAAMVRAAADPDVTCGDIDLTPIRDPEPLVVSSPPG
jgi:hypothetical protein